MWYYDMCIGKEQFFEAIMYVPYEYYKRRRPSQPFKSFRSANFPLTVTYRRLIICQNQLVWIITSSDHRFVYFGNSLFSDQRATGNSTIRLLIYILAIYMSYYSFFTFAVTSLLLMVQYLIIRISTNLSYFMTYSNIYIIIFVCKIFLQNL